jgi:hypothetical protein
VGVGSGSLCDPELVDRVGGCVGSVESGEVVGAAEVFGPMDFAAPSGCRRRPDGHHPTRDPRPAATAPRALTVLPASPPARVKPAFTQPAPRQARRGADTFALLPYRKHLRRDLLIRRTASAGINRKVFPGGKQSKAVPTLRGLLPGCWINRGVTARHSFVVVSTAPQASQGLVNTPARRQQLADQQNYAVIPPSLLLFTGQLGLLNGQP